MVRDKRGSIDGIRNLHGTDHGNVAMELDIIQ